MRVNNENLSGTQPDRWWRYVRCRKVAEKRFAYRDGLTQPRYKVRLRVLYRVDHSYSLRGADEGRHESGGLIVDSLRDVDCLQ